MSVKARPPQTPETRSRIGRLNPHWHPHISHHPWTPRAVLLAAISAAAMLGILIIVLTFVFSSGSL